MDVPQAFLNNIFFEGIGVGIGAEISGSTESVGGGSFYEITPIQTFAWDGGHNTGTAAEKDDWGKAANWDLDIAPATTAQKAIVMAGVVKTATDMNGAYIIHSLTFRADAGPFTISSSTGDTLTIHGGGILNNDADDQTVAVPIKLGEDQNWNASAGNIIVTGAVDTNTKTLTVTGGEDTTISGLISNTGGITKTGAGTLTLSNTGNSFTGDLLVSGGTLLLGASGVLPDATADMTLGGGTFDTGGFDETLATLTLTDNSTIDLGSGSDSLLNFADSDPAATWTSGKILTITNWSGSASGGGSEGIFLVLISGVFPRHRWTRSDFSILSETEAPMAPRSCPPTSLSPCLSRPRFSAPDCSAA
jgi:autotransporter-associated beta strand protein